MESIAVGARLADAHPENSQYQLHRALRLHNLALTYRRANRLREAEPYARDARTRALQCVDRDPAASEGHNILASSSWLLSYLCFLDGRRDEAVALGREAVATFRNLADRHPTVSANQDHPGGSLADLAEFLGSKGQSEEALALCDEAIRRLQTLLDAEPHAAAARVCLSRARRQRAENLQRLGRSTEAVEAWKQTAEFCAGAAETNPGPVEWEMQNLQVVALIRSGQELRASAVASALAGRARTGVELYDAACSLSRVAGALAWCEALPPFSAGPLAQGYAGAAVATLRRARAAGWDDVAQLKQDSDLAPLRDREEFKRLVRELEAKPKP